jgi:hypothetical protein
MESNLAEIRIEGQTYKVPSACIEGRTIIVTGKWIKKAAIMDEELVEGAAVDNADRLIAGIKQTRIRADYFTFAQKPAESKVKYSHRMEWDNAAGIPITSYSDWWEKLPQETRRNVKKAAKLGVTLKKVAFDDELVRGIVEIYNETSVRQGRHFWHYGKSFGAVKEETATYLDRSEFIGAYHDDELIGFIKLVYVDQYASIIHILSKSAHSEKRPTNALIAKAVEICAEKGLSYLLYCKYVYDGNEKSPLTEFKRRNGFEKMCYARYYIPLTTTGRCVLALKLHHGLINIVPKSLLAVLLRIRRKYFAIFDRKRCVAGNAP